MMKKIMKVFTLLGLFICLGACQKGGENNSSSSQEHSLPIVEGEITVNFYVDFTRVNDDDIYYSYTVENGSLLTPPKETPKAIYPEFPVFKGWSNKEVIDDLSDIWDFSKDKIQSTSKTFKMFGIWMAEGE